MRFAREHDLNRSLAREQRQGPIGLAGEQIEPFVGGHPSGKAEGQRARIESFGGSLDVLAHVAAREPVVHAALAYERHKLGPLVLARRPQLGVRDRIESRPRFRIGGPLRPVLAEMPIEQLAHRLADP